MGVLLQLFFEFARAGLFAVGGGLATIPFLQDISARTGWFSQADLANMIAISESTPGPIGINMATYVGFETAGPFGAVIATLGLVAPSIIVILIVAAILEKFRSTPAVEATFYALRPASAAMIAAACWAVAKISIFDIAQTDSFIPEITVRWKGAAIFAAVLVVSRVPRLKRAHPIIWIAMSAIAGAIFEM